MAKRSKQRQARQIKEQVGCMWGLFSMFDFRHGRTTRRLLSDKRQMAMNAVGLECSTSEANLFTDSEERHRDGASEKPKHDVVKTSVKELMEEEMFNEQGSKKHISGDDVEPSDIEHVNHAKNHKPTEKTSKKSFDNQETAKKTSEYCDLEALTKEILLVYQKKNDWQGDLDVGANRSFSVVDEKLNAAVEAFMKDDEKCRHSKDFMDTIQMLSSNKELFLKLLQDSKDVDANEDQKSKSRSNSMEHLRTNPRSEEPVTRKPRNFFRRRSKSQECVSLKGNDSPIHSSRIVILKPGSPDYRFKMENEAHSERSGSHFSFVEIKKRLKHAMGKEQHSEKTVVEGSSGWSSPNRDHFYTERFARVSKRGERVSKLRESEAKLLENEESGDTSHQISNIYIEAKKHLSEMLSNEDEDARLMLGSLPKTLGRILSLPEYGGSPRKETEDRFVTSQTQSSPRGDIKMVNKSQHDDREEKVEVTCDNLDGDSPSSTREDTTCEGAVEIVNSPSVDVEHEEEIQEINVLCEPCSSLNSTDKDPRSEIVEVFDEEKSSQCLKMDLLEEKEFSSPTSSPIEPSRANKTEELESASSDRTGRPSPVSVLEPLFSDNDISPASTGSRPVESAIQPLCIQFEETVSPSENQETCIRNCMESEESAFEYVEALLLASDLNWTEFEKRWLSSIQILDTSLFDEVEIFSSRPSHDQRLLFDATNEILNRVCDHYLGFSYVKRNVHPVPRGMNLINEVWEKIDSNLHTLYPRSLDQLVKKDLGISRTWMDLCPEHREIVFEIDELILDDVIEDTLLSFVDDCVKNEENVVIEDTLLSFVDDCVENEENDACRGS